MDDEILITRMVVIFSPIELNVANGQSGGGSKKDAQGGLVQMKDQDESTRGLAALLNSKNTQTPVGIIIGLHKPAKRPAKKMASPWARKSKYSCGKEAAL